MVLGWVCSGQTASASLIVLVFTPAPLCPDWGFTHARVQVNATAHITGMRLGRRGDRLLVNCSDKCARLVEAMRPTEAHPPFSAAEAASRLRSQKVAHFLCTQSAVQVCPPL